MEHCVGEMVLCGQEEWGDNGSLDAALFCCKGDVGYGFYSFWGPKGDAWQGC